MKNVTMSLMACLMLIMASFNSNAQINIGNGSLVDQALPVEPFYGYTYSQSIYLASEINASGSITGVTFYLDPGSSITNSNDWTVYIGHTTKSSIANNTDWEMGLTQVFSGIVTSAADEVTVTFAVPFAYNGTDNLIIAVDENAASYNGSGDDFLCTATATDRSIVYRNDITNPDPMAPPAATFVRQSIPNIQLLGIAQSCPDPTALAASNLTSTTADITWTAGSGSQLGWEVSVVPTGSPAMGGTASGTTTYNATGLTANTGYDVYVREICAVGDTSGWTGPVSFTTPCAVITPAYLTDFATFLPACWDQAGDGTVATGPTTLGSSLWSQNGTTARINLYTDNRTDWLLSPEFDLSAGGWELVVEASANDYGNAGAFAGMGSDDSVQVVISTDGGATWTTLYSFNTTTPPTLSAANYTVDLSAYTGTSNMFGIRAADGPVNDPEDYYFNVHSFEIRVPPTCAEPTLLSVANIASTSADVTWTAGNGAQLGWEVSVVPTGSPATGGTLSATTTYNATGLMANTGYDVYIREICTVGDTTPWVGPVSFTTLCGVYTPVYTQNYTTYVPECWEEATGFLTSSSTLTGTSSAWTSDGFGNNGSTGAARLNIWTTNQKEWLISPSIDLTGGPFQLEYDIALTTYSGTSATTMDPDDSLAVVVSTDNGATWSNAEMIQVYTAGSEPTPTGYREYIDLSAYTGVVKFGFYGTSTQNLAVDNNIFIDSFVVKPLCMPTYGTDVQTACDSYTWIDGNTYTSSNNTATYTYVGGNAQGCDSIVTLDLTINTTPVATTTVNGAAITADAAGVTYQWLDCGNGNAVMPGETAQTFVAPTTGNYAVEVSENGCIDTSACEMITVAQADLIITEINYNGAESGTDSTEFIEVYNNGAATVNMSGYTFTQGVTYTGGPNTLVPAGGYIVFAVNPSAMVNIYGYNGAYQFTGALSNAGEDIVLVDPVGNVIDTVNYDDAAPWPAGFNAGEPDGGGVSLILCDYNTDNNDGANWSVATTPTGVNLNGFDVFGSPGAANVCINECPSAFSITACDTYTVPSGNATYTTSGVYMDTILGSTGCDSIMTITLTINNATSFTDVQTACDSIMWNGTTYYTSGMYTWTGTNAAGCDSVVTLDLTINNATSFTDVQTACDSIMWNGTTYYTSGMYTWTGTNAAGCDSVVTLDLTINNSTSFTDVQSTCDSLVWNGTTYTTSGMYTWTGTNAAGCDSIVTLDLTILTPATGTDVQTACDSYTWIDGNTYTASNNTATYTFPGGAANGCDSIVTLDLTINTVDVSVTNNDPSITANATGATYVWLDCDNGNMPIAGETNQTFTASANGNYAVEVTQNGCTDTSACTPIVTVSLEETPFEHVAVYPNPVSNIVNVELAGLENAKVRLMDMSGKVLREETCNTTDLFIMEMNQAPGAYILEVRSNDLIKQFKLIKE